MRIRIQVLRDDGFDLEVHTIGSHPTYGWTPLRTPPVPSRGKIGASWDIEVPPQTAISLVQDRSPPAPPPPRPPQLPDPPGTPWRAERIVDGRFE